MTPDDRKYTETHEWIKLDGDIATLGLTNMAQESLGDVVFIEPAVVGKQLKQGDECAAIESVKAASDIYAPVDGEIVEINAELEGEPGLINQDPYDKGWILKLKDVNKDQLDALMDAAAYDSNTGK
jgi:glycine cleavage system H protein